MVVEKSEESEEGKGGGVKMEMKESRSVRVREEEERDAFEASLQEPSNRLSDLLQQDSWRINDSEASNRRDVLGDDVFGVGSWVKKSLDVAVSQESKRTGFSEREQRQVGSRELIKDSSTHEALRALTSSVRESTLARHSCCGQKEEDQRRVSSRDEARKPESTDLEIFQSR